MDEARICVIKEWEVPTKVIELRCFLRFSNYYRRFTSGYSNKAAPLHIMIKTSNCSYLHIHIGVHG